MSITITSEDPATIISLFTDRLVQADDHVRCMRSFRRSVTNAKAYARSPYDYVAIPAQRWLDAHAGKWA